MCLRKCPTGVVTWSSVILLFVPLKMAAAWYRILNAVSWKTGPKVRIIEKKKSKFTWASEQLDVVNKITQVAQSSFSIQIALSVHFSICFRAEIPLSGCIWLWRSHRAPLHTNMPYHCPWVALNPPRKFLNSQSSQISELNLETLWQRIQAVWSPTLGSDLGFTDKWYRES